VTVEQRSDDEVNGGAADVERTESDGVDPDATDAEPAPRQRKSALGSWVRRFRSRLVAAVLAVLLIAAATLAGWLYYSWFRPDQQTDAQAAHAVITAASDGSVALLTYSPDTLDRDFASAKSHLTGSFLSYYDNFTRQIVTPAAKQKGVKTSADVVRAAVSEMHPDSAAVLLFINQITTSADKPSPALAASAVLVRLTKVNGAWLISSFDPV
jgi:Mce-associated membrane protein